MTMACDDGAYWAIFESPTMIVYVPDVLPYWHAITYFPDCLTRQICSFPTPERRRLAVVGREVAVGL